MPETDVVIIGSGGAGLAAALTVGAGGASVTVLEASAAFGGTTAVSGGGMWLPGNTLDPNFTDSMDDAKAYVQRLTLGFVPDSIIDRYLEECGRLPDFLSANTPLSFTAEVGRPDYYAPWVGSALTSRTVFPRTYEMPRLGEMESRIRKPAPRGMMPIQHNEEQAFGVRPRLGDGAVARREDLEAVNRLIAERLAKRIVLRGLALVGGMVEGCLQNRTEFVANSRALELITADGRVVGVQAEEDGSTVEYKARLGVVLASGGFEWNPDLWDTFMTVPNDAPTSPPTNRGDGLIMAASLGAKLGNLGQASWVWARYLGEEYDGRPLYRSRSGGNRPGEIIVNRRGRRFMSEGVTYNDFGREVVHFDVHTYEFTNHPCFVIGDRYCLQRLTDIPPEIYPFSEDPEKPVDDPEKGDGWVVGDTLREVAVQLGIDPDGLERQVAEYNEQAIEGVDRVFNRGSRPWELHNLPNHESLGPITEGPFVGHRIRAGVFGTRGGPVINANAQIIDYHNRPIPGLYGAGAVVAHPFAWAYPGGGGTLGPALTFGHVAGKSLLEKRAGSA